MSVQPQNLLERLYAVVVLLFAMITFSSFVSSITNMMTHLRMLRSVEAKQFAKLERYLQDNKISFHLSFRIRKYLEQWTVEQKHKPHERDVEMLRPLSEPLRMALHYETHSPWLVRQPFFAQYSGANFHAMQQLCHTAIHSEALSRDDVLFSNGETAKATYFVSRGAFDYSRQVGGSSTSEHVSTGQPVAEMVLWTPWEHRGQMRAESQSSLVCVDPYAFQDVVGQSKAAQSEAATYAYLVVEALNACNDHMELDDLEIPSFEPAKVVLKAFKVKHCESRFSTVATRVLQKGKSNMATDGAHFGGVRLSWHSGQEQSWLNPSGPPKALLAVKK